MNRYIHFTNFLVKLLCYCSNVPRKSISKTEILFTKIGKGLEICIGLAIRFMLRKFGFKMEKGWRSILFLDCSSLF